jgi:glucuronate isomerase
MPIIDYHCHINPMEIYEDKQYKTITDIWLGGDHYKWRAMRSCGVAEYYITAMPLRQRSSRSGQKPFPI